MSFTSFLYLYFLALVAVVYWMLPAKSLRNALLLCMSYVFYGFVHPWYLLFIGTSTIVTYASSLALPAHQSGKRIILTSNVILNIGMLAFFKYFSFFSKEVATQLSSFGWSPPPQLLSIVLPVGMSFFTLQSLSYLVDCARGTCAARKNIIDVALLISFFPKLIAGPLERGTHFLPQIEQAATWKWEHLETAGSLLLLGFFKKLAVAEYIRPYVDQIFVGKPPSLLTFVGTLIAFGIQLYADFSGYTDIARGSAQLFGITLPENFREPYLSLTPSDFWRRWNITLSEWIRDYVYIPLGGSRYRSRVMVLLTLLISMGLSGAWHGATVNFVLWGMFWGLLLFAYQSLGFGGHWVPSTLTARITAWILMLFWIVVGWALFRAPSLSWILVVAQQPGDFSVQQLAPALQLLLLLTLIPVLPWMFVYVLKREGMSRTWPLSFAYAILALGLFILSPRNAGDFIYARF